MGLQATLPDDLHKTPKAENPVVFSNFSHGKAHSPREELLCERVEHTSQKKSWCLGYRSGRHLAVFQGTLTLHLGFSVNCGEVNLLPCFQFPGSRLATTRKVFAS